MEDVAMETDDQTTSYPYTTELIEANGDSTHTEIVNNEENSCVYPTLFSTKTLLELCNCSWSRALRAKEDVQPYLRGCKWSPDGTCCLSVVNNDGMHLTELPRDLYEGSPSSSRHIDVLDSVVHVKEAGLVYDFCWYPGMNSSVPESCCWISTKQNAPIQMWDAFDGSLRCSYRGFNAVDELEPALSVTFSIDGSRIVAGYKKVLRTFDVDRPGREYSEHKISAPAACAAVNSDMLAIGSWNTTISLYSVNELGTYKSIGKMHGHFGGVTHLKFTPNGQKLVSGARKDHRLLIWDVRFYRRPLTVLTRCVGTNQRVYFDVSPCGRYLASGGDDGVLRGWASDSGEWEESGVTYKFPLHQDCCNSVSIHPIRPILATGSGQYHFTDPIRSIDEECRTDSEEFRTDDDQARAGNGLNSQIDEVRQENIDMKYSTHTENSLVFWWTDELADLK